VGEAGALGKTETMVGKPSVIHLLTEFVEKPL